MLAGFLFTGVLLFSVRGYPCPHRDIPGFLFTSSPSLIFVNGDFLSFDLDDVLALNVGCTNRDGCEAYFFCGSGWLNWFLVDSIFLLSVGEMACW